MRKNITDRLYRVYTHQPVDRVPDVEFGYWTQTIRRWLREGLPLALSPEEQNQAFNTKLDAFFGFENEGFGLFTRTQMNPVFEEKILERRGEAVVMLDSTGALAERYPDTAEDCSIPHFIEFPVKNPAHWPDMKARFRLDDPVRDYPAADLANVRRAAAGGKAIGVFFVGFYGQLRNWLGMENLSYAFYDYPDMIHDMTAHWAELCTRQIERLPADIVIDQVMWWEDMACKNGPLVSPAIFREFIQPGYRRVMRAARQRGCALGIVDSDGNPHDLVPLWLAEGVNIMFPLEVAAGVDPYAWRKEFGMELRLKGGVAKRPLVEGRAAIDRELERIRPLLEQGGYIPHLDHLVPPDVPYGHYQYYLEKKRKLIGKA